MQKHSGNTPSCAMRTSAAMLLCVLMLCCAFASAAQATNTDNHGIHAVPVPSSVLIDGKLNDWDLTGGIFLCYDVENLKDIYSARVDMMYDTQNLYIAIRWKSPEPLVNSHDPRFQANKGWAGDSVQLRVKTDRISHVTAWCYAAKMEPYIGIDYGKSLNQPFGGGSIALFQEDGWKLRQGAEMAFLKDADGKGYVQEIKLPWKLLTSAKQFAAGDQFSCGVELLWGGADWPVHRFADNLAEGETSREFFWTAKNAWGPVFLSAKGALALPEPEWAKALKPAVQEGPVEISYELPYAARVTLAIDDANGTRVRNLLAAAERPTGKNVELWDGLDDKGMVVTPGSYTVKGLHHEGLHLKYATSFASPGNPGWKTADGKGGFYGDHTPPMAAAAGKEIVALACPMAEAGEHLIGVDYQGRRQWGLANRMFAVSRRVALATDGTTLWIANGEGPENVSGIGVANSSYQSARFTIWRCELATGKYAAWQRTGPDGKAVLDLALLEKEGSANCRTLAVRGGKLAVPLVKQRRLLLLNAETGDTLKEYQQLPEKVGGVAFASDSELLLTAADGVYALDLESGKQSLLFGNLADPRGIAINGKGEILIAQGAQKQCVNVYDRQGALLRTIGLVGGRPEYGFFQKDGMREPAQIALDAQGRLWVPESTMNPKRTSIWNADGKLAFDLTGTTQYSAGGILSPADPTRAISENVEYKLDYPTQSARPLYAIKPAVSFRENECGYPARIVLANGKEYLQTASSGIASGWVWLFLRTQDGAWRPVATFGNVGEGKPGEKRYEEYNRNFVGPLWDGEAGNCFLWTDNNEDGQAQRAEMQFAPGHFGGFYWGQMIDNDLTVAFPAGGQEIAVFPAPQFSPAGIPLYRFADRKAVTASGKVGGEGMLLASGNGRIYLNQTPLQAIDANGKTLWTYPNDFVSVHGSHRAPSARPGLLIGPSKFYGTAKVNNEIGEVFYLNGNLGQNFLFTEDGLWVQSLYNDARGWSQVPDRAIPGMPCDAMTAGGESFGGGFVKCADGKYYTVGGGTSAVVMEVTGLDTLRRFGGSVVLTAQDATTAQELKTRKAAELQKPRAFRIQRTASPMPLTGDLSAWAMDKDRVSFKDNSGHTQLVKAFYDQKNLYLYYKVADASPLLNAGQDDKLMFITGDGVDLMLRTGAQAKGDKPTSGDLRLLLTIKNGKPLAALYEAVVPTAAKADGVDLSSPWRTVHMDRFRTPDFPLHMQKIPGGYRVTAAVPLELLGLQDCAGRTLRGDFGILSSNSAGQECTARTYWSNKATNNTNDVPDEAMLTPGLWGDLVFE